MCAAAELSQELVELRLEEPEPLLPAGVPTRGALASPAEATGGCVAAPPWFRAWQVLPSIPIVAHRGGHLLQARLHAQEALLQLPVGAASGRAVAVAFPRIAGCVGGANAGLNSAAHTGARLARATKASLNNSTKARLTTVKKSRLSGAAKPDLSCARKAGLTCIVQSRLTSASKTALGKAARTSLTIAIQCRLARTIEAGHRSLARITKAGTRATGEPSTVKLVLPMAAEASAGDVLSDAVKSRLPGATKVSLRNADRSSVLVYVRESCLDRAAKATLSKTSIEP